MTLRKVVKMLAATEAVYTPKQYFQKKVSIKARDILHLHYRDIWYLENECNVEVIFDDGKVEGVLGTLVIISQVLWKIQRIIPNAPLLKIHLHAKQVSPHSHSEVLGHCINSTLEHVPGVDVEDLWRLAYEAFNALYNMGHDNCQRYVDSMNILDMIEILDDPDISHIKEHVQPTKESVSKAFTDIQHIIKDKTKFIGNPIALASQAEILSTNQILQCIAMRGYMADLNGRIFTKPILTGYVEGINTIEDALMESRTTSRSLALTKDPLRQIEYMNRQIQIIAASLHSMKRSGIIPDVVYSIHDCGSRSYMQYTLRQGDLKNFDGKYYTLDPNGIADKAITVHNKELIGKTVYLRSPALCNELANIAICEKCYGKLSLQLPKFTNVGHTAGVQLGAQAAQRSMSNKHYEGSAHVEAIDITDYTDFIDYEGSGSRLKLSEELMKYKSVQLRIKEREFPGISRLDYYASCEKLDVQTLIQISSFSEIEFICTQDNPENPEEELVTVQSVLVSTGNRKAFFTEEMIAYIGSIKIIPSEKDTYRIDLTDWSLHKAFLDLPQIQQDSLAAVKEIESFIRAPLKAINETRSRKKDKLKPDELTLELVFEGLYNMVISQFDVNIVHLEILLISTMVKDPINREYGIPASAREGSFGHYAETMRYRSIAPNLAWQEQSKTFLDPVTYLINSRQPSPFDNLIRSQKVPVKS